MINNLLKAILFGFLAMGLYGATSVSYTTITSTAPCPAVGFIPACFIVFTGYLLMLAATISLNLRHQLHWLFLVGWTPVFLLAFVGSIFEISNGATCPKSSTGLALCHVSLSFAVVVATLYGFLVKFRWAKHD